MSFPQKIKRQHFFLPLHWTRSNMGPSIIPKQSHSLSKAEPEAHRVAMTSTSPDQSLSVDEKNRQRFKSDPRQPHTVVEVSERLDRGTPASHLPPPLE